jgi:hypothetical protein
MRRGRPSFSNSEVREIAKRSREYFGLSLERRIDPIRCVKSPKIWTIFGEKPLRYIVIPDDELGKAYAKTTHRPGDVEIKMAATVERNATMGDGRARNTYAHEICHATMHLGEDMPRLVVDSSKDVWLKPYEDREHHAKVFAPAFLINDEVAATLSSAEMISIEFGISLESAEIYFSEMMQAHDRQNAARRIQKIADDFRAQTRGEVNTIIFVNHACPKCGADTVFPVGTMYMCKTCDEAIGKFPDGDV